MPVSPFRKVTPGDKLRVPAAAWNDLMDLLRRSKGEGLGLGADIPQAFLQGDVVRVKNASGSDAPRFGVLGIDGVLFTPEDNEDEFKRRVTLRGVTPDEDYHQGKFVLLLEPIPDGKFGMAALTGVFPAKLNVQSEGDGYADVEDGVMSRLLTGTTGAAQVLWKESGTGEKWGVVRLGLSPPFDIIGFAGVCKVDEANPDTQYPGSDIAYNQADQYGNPKPGEREWLLVKCERPIKSRTDNDPGQEAHFPMQLSVTMGGASKYWWEYYLITEDFEIEGDDCATWNTKPTMEWGTDGLIDSNFGLSATLSSAGRHLSCCYPGFGYERTVYGICLRPYLWYLGSTSSNSTHEVDYRKWLVRL